MILFSLLIIIIIDNTLSFTYSYNNSSKIEQIEKLNSIVSHTTLSNTEIYNLKTLRTNIINHKTWKDQLYNKIIAIDFKSKDGNNPVVKDDKPQPKVERNYWIHFVTSSWLFTFIMIIIPFIGLFDKKTPFLSTFIAVVFLIEPIFYGLSWLFAKGFSFIPVIDNNPNINYVINAILHLIIFLLIGLIIKKFEKKKRPQLT